MFGSLCLFLLNKSWRIKTTRAAEYKLREGAKKNLIVIVDQSVNGRGGEVNPLSSTKIVFFQLREKDAE